MLPKGSALTARRADCRRDSPVCHFTGASPAKSPAPDAIGVRPELGFSGRVLAANGDPAPRGLALAYFAARDSFGSRGPGGCALARASAPAAGPASMLARTAMAELVDRIRSELERRSKLVRPVVGEFERLQRAVGVIAGTGTRALPGREARPPSVARAASKRANSAAGTKPAAGKASPKRRAVTSGRPPAPRGQIQAKVLAALRAAPGSTTAAVAKTTGILASTVATTISRLVRQQRVRRLDEGGYTLVEPPVDAAATTASDDATTAASNPPAGQAPTTETRPATARPRPKGSHLDG
jgi:hypothetical protein